MSHETPAGETPHNERCRQFAHDIKNSLSVIGTGLEVMKITCPEVNSEEFDEICAMMDRERKTATDLVGDFLAVALRGED